MANVMLEMFDGCSLVWILMYRHSRSSILHTIMQELLVNHSLFLFCMCIDASFQFTPKSAISELQYAGQSLSWNACYIYLFSNSNFVVICKTWTEGQHIRIHTKEKQFYTSNISFAILPFHQKVRPIPQLNCHFRVL